MRRAFFATCVAVLALGCGPSSDKVFKARMASAHEARADVDRAVALYDDAARGAARSEDAMAAREAAATLLERSARTAEAERRWAAIASDPQASASDKGTAELRLIGLRSANEVERFEAERAWLVAHPSHAAAPKIVREQFLGRESDAARERFADELLALPAADRIAPWLRLEKARIAARAGRLGEAVAAMELLAKADPYPRGVLFDDAVDEGSTLALQLGDAPRARRLLDLAFAEHESAWIVGSANRPRFPAIFLRRARLQESPEAARRAYRAMIDAVPEAREAGEARYELALLEHQAARPREACALAKELVERDAKRLAARCVARACPSVSGALPASEDECGLLAQRFDDDRRGALKGLFDR